MTLKTSRMRRERGKWKTVKRNEMRDIDEDSDIEDIKKRGMRRGMRDIDEDSELKTSRREERERDERY